MYSARWIQIISILEIYFRFYRIISECHKEFHFLYYLCNVIVLTTMANNKKNLNRIKVILAEKGLQNKWLAKQLGRDEATVSKWVTNSTQPSLDMLIKIAKALNVNINELVRFDEV